MALNLMRCCLVSATAIFLLVTFLSPPSQAQHLRSAGKGSDKLGSFTLSHYDRPRLPAGAVERPRDTSAPNWAAPFCSQWTDDCVTCRGSALSDAISCYDRSTSTCVPKKVRCIDIDETVAPLFCTIVDEECGGIIYGVNQDGRTDSVSHGLCPIEHKREHPQDYKCISNRKRVEDCVANNDKAWCRDELKEARKVTDRYQALFRDLLRQSVKVR